MEFEMTDNKKRRFTARKLAIAGVSFAMAAFASVATAGPYGFDLHNVLSPRAGGMVGTTIAGENGGPVEAVYGNPANLADFMGGTEFAFGATFYYPEAVANHDGRVLNFATSGNLAPSEAFSYRVRSNAEFYAVPQIGITQDLHGVGIPVVLGLGVSAVSGIGVHYRREPLTLGQGAEFIVLGINAGAGYEVSDKLDLGVAATISYGMLEAGLAGSSGQGHDYGLRLTLGGDYHLTDKTDIGFYYQTELEHTWNDFISLGNSNDPNAGSAVLSEFNAAREAAALTANYHSLTVDQPANYALGVSHQFNDNLRVAADVIYKVWSEAAFWDRFYHDQTAITVGAELDQGPWTFRAGYGYANDPSKQARPGTLEGFDHVCSGLPGLGAAAFAPQCFPLVGAAGGVVWDWLQAMETPVIYRHRASAGFTYEGFLAPFLSLDAHVAHQLQEDREYSVSGTDLDVQSWHAGFALTWKF